MIAAEAEVKLEDLDPGRPLDELGIDSLSVLQAMFEIEDKFGIKMPDERVPIRTVQDIADIVDRLVAEKAGRPE
ncbi:MAG TPA: phosphopantetheine-binding protein [Burkholderiales bacterium]|nr:phosphopantetheine-binding protein [Burkholderiales bacterium]